MKFINLKNNIFVKSRMEISIFLSLLLCIIEGTGITWPSPMLKKLEDLKDNPLGRKITTDESSLLASLPILGSILGSFLIMGITNKLGRKPLLILHGTASLFCNLILAFSANIWLYYLARFVAGFNSAAIVILVPMYICELADPSSRGSLGTGMIASINIGILIPFTLGPYIRFIWYHLFLTLIPISFMILFSIFALESPYYYLQSDPSRAEDLLRHLKGKQDVTDTLKEMKRSLDDTTKDSFLLQIKMKGTRKTLLIGIGLVTFLTGVGANVLITYAQMIFDSAGGNWSGEVDNIIVGIIQLMVSLFSATIMDKFKRKHLLSVSSCICGCFMGFLSIYFILKDEAVALHGFGWLPLVSFIGFVSFYNLGLGPLGNTVLGEMFPQSVKTFAMSLCCLWNNILGFLTTFIFQRLEQCIGLGETLIIFSIMGLLGTVFIQIFIVETRGKTLEEIQDELNNVKKEKIGYSHFAPMETKIVHKS